MLALRGGVAGNSTQCLQQLALMLNGQAAYSGEVGPLMLMSYGKGFGDLGDYETCEQLGSGTARYAWVTTIRDAGMNAALGLCVPALCDEGSLPGSIAFLLDRLFNTTGQARQASFDIKLRMLLLIGSFCACSAYTQR